MLCESKPDLQVDLIRSQGIDTIKYVVIQSSICDVLTVLTTKTCQSSKMMHSVRLPFAPLSFVIICDSYDNYRKIIASRHSSAPQL